ncbi:MAG: 16S rRNA (cytosine(967)-C(5))-methyltransferase RsmB, partial [Limnobacter sp.]|nr:16S rRNA (cytosine(967)-C(5))-methyltransferase RsmB [Limnobacter sp.]
MSGRLLHTDLAFALLKATEVIAGVMRQGQSLDRALADALKGIEVTSVRGAVADLSYFGLRWRGRGLALVRSLTGKPKLKPEKLQDFLALCFSLIWSPQHEKYPPYTLVNEAVNACASSKDLRQAKGFVNACLRNFLREPDKWLAQSGKSVEAQWNFPKWWVKKIRQQHPEHWSSFLEQANTHPPMVLRVNSRCSTGQEYVKRLANDGLAATLLEPQTVLVSEPVPVHQLPGFAEGEVSVQDRAAQMAGKLMAPKDGQRILDACAAPGGKTGHVLELAEVDLLALDSSEQRLKRVQENYDRIKPTLGQQHRLSIRCAPAEQVDQWWDGQPFDAILADLPCSGSGVVRRHPDIRWLRREEDLIKLSQIQHTILNSLWPTLNPGGTLLLVTCSIFLEEGPDLLEAFVQSHADAQVLNVPGVVYP